MNSSGKSIHFQVILLTAVRTIMNTANRMVYPFLAVFARGLGVDIVTISLVMSARSFTAMLNPFLAPTVEQRGRKAGMLMAIALFTLANTVLFLRPTFTVFFITQCVSYLSLYFFFSSIHAFIGDQIPYEVRGRSSAVLEFSWSLSFILGVPLVGLLIEHAGWQSAFPLFAVLGMISFCLVARIIPAPSPAQSNHLNLVSGLKQILKSRATVAGLVFSVLFHTGNEVVNLVFGVWMEDSFGLKIAALGGAALVIGLADLTGETLSAIFVDRLGKRRAVAIGVSLNILCALALPWMDQSVWSALLGLFLYFLSFEFVIVCFLPIMSEVQPKARATVLSYEVAAHAAGRGLGALLLPALFAAGFTASALASAAFGVVSLLLLSQVKVAADMKR